MAGAALFALWNSPCVAEQSTSALLPSLGGALVTGSTTIGDLSVVGPSASQIEDASALSTLSGYATMPVGLALDYNPVFVAGQSPNASTSALSWQGSEQGVCNNGAPCAAIFLQANFVSGTAVFPAELLRANAVCCSSSFTGSYQTVEVDVSVNATSGNISASPGYVAFIASATGYVNDNGTSGEPNGNLVGANVKAALFTAASYWSAVEGEEIDVTLGAGTGARVFDGMVVVLQGSNAVSATNENNAYTVSAGQGATPTIVCAYCVGSYQGQNPLASSASLMQFLLNQGIGSAPTITNGIHLNTFAGFTGNAFDSPGFSVTGGAAVTAAAYNVTAPVANTQMASLSGGSITGSSTSAFGLSIAGALDTTGVVDGAALLLDVTNTSSGSGSTTVDVRVDGSSVFNVDVFGDINATGGLVMGASNFLTWNSRSHLTSTANGTIKAYQSNGSTYSDIWGANFYSNGAQGLSSKTCTINTSNVSAGITITIQGGLATATSGC
jgi:hypothetical protein